VGEFNRIFKKEAASEKYQGVLGVTEDPLVSSDIIQGACASVVDLGDDPGGRWRPEKVLSWHGNEWGYASQMIREAVRLVKGFRGQQ